MLVWKDFIHIKHQLLRREILWGFPSQSQIRNESDGGHLRNRFSYKAYPNRADLQDKSSERTPTIKYMKTCLFFVVTQ